MNLENLANIINNELLAVGKNFINLQAEPSDASRALVTNLADKVGYTIGQVIQAVRENDETAAKEVIALKVDIHRIADNFLTHQSERIAIQDRGYLNLIRLEMELLDKLRSIYTLTKRIAKDFAA